MKKSFIILVLALPLVQIISAQEPGAFRFGLGLGPTLSGTNGYGVESGFILAIEPGVHVQRDLVIGLRLELAATHLLLEDLYVIGISSVTINGQYYLSAGNFRPFIGMGLGGYGSSDFDRDDSAVNFGVYPRAGFDLGHFSITVDYNIILSPPRSGSYMDNFNYFGFRVGFFLGGGRKASVQPKE